jgi:serine kinase of HPr protein (carbohydrate metabolism regulator)
MGEIVLARASEMNYYVREDIASIYPEFEALVETRKLDKQGRTIADIREVLGVSKAKDETCIEKVILLKRDPEDELYYELSGEEALTFIVDNDFCNPHQLVRDERKLRIRKRFFQQYFDRVETFMVNTITPPQETQSTIRNIVFGPNSSPL